MNENEQGWVNIDNKTVINVNNINFMREAIDGVEIYFTGGMTTNIKGVSIFDILACIGVLKPYMDVVQSKEPATGVTVRLG